MGSIPTHSRQISRALVAVLALGALFAAIPGTAGAEQEWEGPTPFRRAVRSVVFPAWGQVTNGKTTKATLLFGFQSYLWTRIVLETRAAHESDRIAAAATDPGAAEVATLAAEDHYGRRRDLVFWTIVASFYGAVDAYVDAYLGNFEKELGEGRELFSGLSEDGTALEVGVRF